MGNIIWGIIGVIVPIAIMPSSYGTEKKIQEYLCSKVPVHSIKVDGKLDEAEWKNQTELLFYDIEDASIPRYPVTAKIVWDDDYIYIGYEIKDTEITGSSEAKGKRAGNEEDVLKNVAVVEFFIDPDGDGRNYVEFHVNSLAGISDSLMEAPRDRDAQRECGIDVRGETQNDYGWNCEGLEAAVHIEKNRSWSVEMAIPRKPILCAQNRGVCKILLVHHRKLNEESLWWSWPVLKVRNCHFPSRWGILRFKEGK